MKTKTEKTSNTSSQGKRTIKSSKENLEDIFEDLFEGYLLGGEASCESFAENGESRF